MALDLQAMEDETTKIGGTGVTRVIGVAGERYRKTRVTLVARAPLVTLKGS